MKTILRVGLAVMTMTGLSETPLRAQDPVKSVKVTRLEATPSTVTVAAGDSVGLVVTAYDASGRVVEAPIRMAALGRPVKEMIGGTTGWVDEGFELVTE